MMIHGIFKPGVEQFLVTCEGNNNSGGCYDICCSWNTENTI